VIYLPIQALRLAMQWKSSALAFLSLDYLQAALTLGAVHVHLSPRRCSNYMNLQLLLRGAHYQLYCIAQYCIIAACKALGTPAIFPRCALSVVLHCVQCSAQHCTERKCTGLYTLYTTAKHLYVMPEGFLLFFL